MSQKYKYKVWGEIVYANNFCTRNCSHIPFMLSNILRNFQHTLICVKRDDITKKARRKIPITSMILSVM